MKKIPLHKTDGSIDPMKRLNELNRRQLHAVLATDANGQPYTSLVAFALSPDKRGVLFATPRKTSKYKNILKNPNVSLMVDSRSNSPKGYMKSEAITILGRATPLRKGRKRSELAETMIKKHPHLSDFVNADSTALVLITFTQILHAGQFQSISVWTPGQ